VDQGAQETPLNRLRADLGLSGATSAPQPGTGAGAAPHASVDSQPPMAAAAQSPSSPTAAHVTAAHVTAAAAAAAGTAAAAPSGAGAPKAPPVGAAIGITRIFTSGGAPKNPFSGKDKSDAPAGRDPAVAWPSTRNEQLPGEEPLPGKEPSLGKDLGANATDSAPKAPAGAPAVSAAAASAVRSASAQAAAPQATAPQATPAQATAVTPAEVAAMPVEYSGPTQRDDPLLSCLVIMTRIFGSPKSPAALATGLPIPEEGMTPDLFLRAADRAGFSANKLKRKLDAVDAMSLPAVLLLKGHKACVLLSPPRAGMVEIATPDNLDGSHSYPLAELEAAYTGQQILVRPKIRLDTRSADLTEAKPRNWFWTNVAKFTPVYAEVVVAALLINIFTIATSIFSMQVYDRVVPNKAAETMWVLAIGAITIFAFDFMLRTLRAYFLDHAGKALDKKVSSALFEHMLSIRMASGPQSAGAFASNILSYENLRDFFTSATLSALIDLPFVLIFMVIIFVIAGPIAVVPGILVPVVIGVSILVQVPMKHAAERSYRESAQKHAMLVEAINGLDTIKTTSAEGQMQRNWDGYVAASADSSKISRFWSTIAINLVVMASNFAFVGVLIVGCYEIFTHNPGDPSPALTTGAMVAASMLTSRAMAPLGQIAGLIVRFHQSWTSLKGLNRMMELPVERPRGKVFLRRPHIDGAIEFRNVTFKYPNAQTPALDGVSFRIAPGEKVGIVGRIGSGKTTIERLVMGLFEPTEGAVLVDGTDIRQLDPTDLRGSIGCVLQDPHLFFGSVKDNITLGAPYADEESILRAATLSGVDQFVRQHPLGYDMPVGENGRYLSGGQRQSVAVARALLLNPPILVLDEPTSSMDNSTENAFKAQLAGIVQDKTLLLVTHRNSMLSLVDRLIVMDRGKIVADGPKAGVLDALMKGRVKANEG
jgi:ATP-binding cassette subfamily C protein LapB